MLMNRVEQGIIPISPVTDLNLFNYSKEEFTKNIGQVEFINEIIKFKELSTQADTEFYKQIFDRLNILKENDKKIYLLRDKTFIQATFGEAFLIIDRDLSAFSISQEDKFTFFQNCLNTNNKIFEFSSKKSTISNSEKINQFNKNLQDVKKPPWFNGSDLKWFDFLRKYSNFSILINSGKSINMINQEHKDNGLFGETNSKAEDLPDWLIEPIKDIPKIEDIEERAIEFKEEINSINIDLSNNYTEMDKIILEINEKISKNNKSILEEIVSLSLLRGFSGKLITKYFINYIINEVRLSYEENINFKSITKKDKNLNLDTSSSEYLYSLQNKKHKEDFALWLEKEFIDSKTGILSVKNPLNDQASKYFNLFLEYITNKTDDSISSEWKEVKNESKVLYNFLQHDVKPYLDNLSPYELSFLQVYFNEKKGDSFESIIFIFAEYMLQGNQKIKDKKPDKKMDKLETFINKWINDNFEYYFEEINKLTKNGFIEQATEYPKSENLELIIEKQVDKQLEKQKIIKSINQETQNTLAMTEKIKKLSIVNWKLFITINPNNNNQTNLTHIKGENKEEMTSSLREYMGINNTPSSLDPHIYIDSLELMLNHLNKSDHLFSRLRESINGIEYFKIKKRRMRIFYLIDEAKNEIIFYLHKKEKDANKIYS